MRSWIVRGFLVLLGIFVGLVGLVLWSAEKTYGSDAPNFAIQTDPGKGRSIVYALDETAQERTEVFEGTEEEAEAYIDQQSEQAGGRNFLAAGLVIAAGAVLVVAALLWPRRAKPTPDAPTRG